MTSPDVKAISKVMLTPNMDGVIKHKKLSAPTGESTDSESVVALKLLPPHGELDAETFKTHTEEFKIMVSVVNDIIEQLPDDQRDSKGITGAFLSNSLIEQHGDEINRNTTYLKKDITWILQPGSKKPDIVQVSKWFEDLINESTIRGVSRVGTQDLTRIIDFFERGGNSYREQETAEFGILRHAGNQCFFLYSITLVAWYKVTKHLLSLSTETRCGIRGAFTNRIFIPNPVTMNTIEGAKRDQTISEVERAFASPFP